MRHAYGSLGRLLTGQTWTNFFNEKAYIETLDFGGSRLAAHGVGDSRGRGWW